jgi:hypothetical protein
MTDLVIFMWSRIRFRNWLREMIADPEWTSPKFLISGYSSRIPVRTERDQLEERFRLYAELAL